VSLKSKKQIVVSKSSAESEYRAMTDFKCELVSIQDILIEMDFVSKTPIRLYCDNSQLITFYKILCFMRG